MPPGACNLLAELLFALLLDMTTNLKRNLFGKFFNVDDRKL